MNVDEFVVQLGLDPTELTEQQRNILRAIAQLKSDAAKDVKKVENEFAKAADAVESGARRMVNVISLIIGTASATEFAKKTIEDVRQLGIMSDLIQVNIRELSAFGNTFDRLGGSAEGVFSTLSGIDREIKSLETNIMAPGDSKLLDVIRQLNALGANIQTHTDSGRWRKPTEMLLEIAEWTPKLKATEDRIKGILRQLPGMNDETLAVMLRSADSLREQLKLQQDILAVTKDDRDAYDQLRQKWTELSQSAQQVGVNIMTTVAKPLEVVLGLISKFLKDYVAVIPFPILAAASIIARGAGQAMGGEGTPIIGVPAIERDRRRAAGGGPAGGAGPPPNEPTNSPSAGGKGWYSPVTGTGLGGGAGGTSASMGAHRHQGDDIMAAYGSNVYAAKEGTVVRIGRDNWNTPVVTIRHNDGTYTRYMHLSSVSVNVGDTVKGGVGIGKSGSANGVAHLHFEAWNGMPNRPGSEMLNPRRIYGWGRENLPKGGQPLDPGEAWGQNIKPMLYPGVVTGGRANVIQNIGNSARVEIGQVTVNSKAENPAGIAGDIAGALKEQSPF